MHCCIHSYKWFTLQFLLVSSITAFSPLISKYVLHLLTVEYFSFSSLGDFLREGAHEVTLALSMLPAFPHILTHHTFLIMLLSLANLDSFSNLSYFHLTPVEDFCYFCSQSIGFKNSENLASVAQLFEHCTKRPYFDSPSGHII